MSFLQKRRAVLAGTCTCSHYYKAALLAAFLLGLACFDSGPGLADDRTDAGRAKLYLWPGLQYRAAETIERRVPVPDGTRRIPVKSGSFGKWLRGLPLKAGRPQVLLHDGRVKTNQAAHHAVIDIDTGARDLQQCADAVMRLRAEHLFATGDAAQIRFRFTDESEARYSAWARGERPQIRPKRKTRWIRTAAADSSYAGFRKYLRSVFTYAGTYSLSRESRKVKLADMRIGDFFIQGGFPGHAVIVVDMAESVEGNPAARRRYFLLAQSYMPAQDMHVLRNPAGDSPWYLLEQPAEYQNRPGHVRIRTPEWEFAGTDLMRFRD